MIRLAFALVLAGCGPKPEVKPAEKLASVEAVALADRREVQG
jgi:hypothetical protein